MADVDEIASLGRYGTGLDFPVLEQSKNKYLPAPPWANLSRQNQTWGEFSTLEGAVRVRHALSVQYSNTT